MYLTQANRYLDTHTRAYMYMEDIGVLHGPGLTHSQSLPEDRLRTMERQRRNCRRPHQSSPSSGVGGRPALNQSGAGNWLPLRLGTFKRLAA